MICRGNMGRAVFLATITGLLSPTRDEPAKKAKVEPTSAYQVRKIEGWTVLVNKRFLKSRPDVAEQTLALLRFQLFQIVRRLPAKAVTKLRKVRIWVEENEPRPPCMAYHPGDARWLREHGKNPEKADGAEIGNAGNFLKWTLEQPWMVLHELAHGYHHQFLKDGYKNAEIKEAFERAKDSKRYDSVLRIGGKEEKAYAMENPPEYFAESTEAFFGTNDFYPFVRGIAKTRPGDVRIAQKTLGRAVTRASRDFDNEIARENFDFFCYLRCLGHRVLLDDYPRRAPTRRN